MDDQTKAALKEIPYVSIVMGVLDLATLLIERGKQTGELTDEQASALYATAQGIFGKYAQPAPRPKEG